MIPTWVDSVCHLAGHSDIDCNDCGRHDELAAALIAMQAYEASRAASSIKRRLSDEFVQVKNVEHIHVQRR
jgi:hypothetical protein